MFHLPVTTPRAAEARLIHLLENQTLPPEPSPPPQPPELDTASAPVHVPARGQGIRVGLERAMAQGRAVLVESGQHVWGTDIMAVWPSARVHLRSRVFRGACLMGQWEMSECSGGVVAATNLTHSMAEHGEQTVWVRGSTWVFEDCDIRCYKGLAVRVTNGWREIAAAGNLEPLELCRAIDDQKARVIPANSSFHRCGLGGADPDRVGREGHLDPEDRQARCAVDVCDDSEVLLEQCSVHDTSVFALRVMHRAQMTVNRGHVAHALNGLLVQHHGRLRLSESRVQKVWLGAAVSVRGAGAAVVDQCDLKQCSTGLILEGAADVRMTYSAVINCTFSAFHQVSGDEGDDGMGGGDHGGCIADEPLREVTIGGNVHNRCRLTLIGNSVYSTLSRHVWWDKSRPAFFVAEANCFEDDPEPVVTAAEEAEAERLAHARASVEEREAANIEWRKILRHLHSLSSGEAGLEDAGEGGEQEEYDEEEDWEEKGKRVLQQWIHDARLVVDAPESGVVHDFNSGSSG